MFPPSKWNRRVDDSAVFESRRSEGHSVEVGIGGAVK